VLGLVLVFLVYSLALDWLLDVGLVMDLAMVWGGV